MLWGLKNMSNILTSPLFNIFITFGLYTVYTFLYAKFKFPLLNPLLLTSTTIIIYLVITGNIFNLTLNDQSSNYASSMSMINSFLSPLTVCLAIPIFNRIQIIKQYFLPILVGSVVGSFVSIFSIKIFGKLFNLDETIIVSMIPKSVTTPIAIEISNNLGGLKGITVSSVVLTGVLGSLFGPIILKFLNIKRSPAVGMALGGTSHAVGTSKAVEISSRAGAISSVAIVTSGILTVIISLFL